MSLHVGLRRAGDRAAGRLGVFTALALGAVGGCADGWPRLLDIVCGAVAGGGFIAATGFLSMLIFPAPQHRAAVRRARVQLPFGPASRVRVGVYRHANEHDPQTGSRVPVEPR